MKKARVFQPAGDLPKERSSLLTISNKFGLTFVGLDKTFKVYQTQDILATDKVDGNSNEIGKDLTILLLTTHTSTSYLIHKWTQTFYFVLVDGIAALAEVTVELALHHLALSCDELTLSVCGATETAGLSLTFYDVRTLINKVITYLCILCLGICIRHKSCVSASARLCLTNIEWHLFVCFALSKWLIYLS